jgi:predicted  nucleic acid-binding Zn-ribbon protein
MADQWQSIRPWIHRFALSVNQVSSVSATFTLKSALTTRPDDDPALESIVKNEGEDGSTEHPDPSMRSHAVSDALTQGLSVKVNSSPWQRVLLRVDEESDQAIIIVFGLMPGRQYDVELGITQRQQSLRSQITTDTNTRQSLLVRISFPSTASIELFFFLSFFHPASDRTNPNRNERDDNNGNGSIDLPFVVSTSATTTHNITNSLTTPPDPTPSPSPSPSASPTLSASTSGEIVSSVPTPSVTVEDKVQQLNQTLSILESERDSLVTSLKTTRRDAQRADAAIRADIETLKRASDKFASVEHRARQKVLALQEAVKQTLAAAADINTAVTDVENSVPSLREQQTEAEKEFELAKRQAAQARQEREALESREKKRTDSLQTELAGLGGKLERLNGKREKLENNVIPDLEKELKRLEEEIAKAACSLPPPTPDRFDDVHYHDPLAGNQSGSTSAGGFPDDLHLAVGPIENPRARRKHQSHPPSTAKRQQPQIQKPVQILRPPHQQQVRPTATGGTTTSTLSSLAAPFEPSPKRQAQLQNTLRTSLDSTNITSALKAELNSPTTVFAPRMGFTTSSTSASRKSTVASPNNSTPGLPAWSRGNQKPL